MQSVAHFTVDDRSFLLINAISPKLSPSPNRFMRTIYFGAGVEVEGMLSFSIFSTPARFGWVFSLLSPSTGFYCFFAWTRILRLVGGDSDLGSDFFPFTWFITYVFTVHSSHTSTSPLIIMYNSSPFYPSVPFRYSERCEEIFCLSGGKEERDWFDISYPFRKQWKSQAGFARTWRSTIGKGCHCPCSIERRRGFFQLWSLGSRDLASIDRACRHLSRLLFSPIVTCRWSWCVGDVFVLEWVVHLILGGSRALHLHVLLSDSRSGE